MKLSSTLLRQYIALPHEPRALRDLLDDVGIEVKRMHAESGDVRMTVELLANRGDHHCYAGIAREISGRTGDPVCPPEITWLETGPPPVELRCETDLCLRYSATLLVAEQAPGTLNPEQLAPLEVAELHSVGAAVDATNLSSLELGQPTHAFDADRIEGGITIRVSRPGERAWPLFTEGPVKLPAGTLVIADDAKVLAIAGVIGCEESKATEATRRLVLESATFDPVAVRKAARALELSTDASTRFERGADPSAPLVGAGRVVHLLEQVGGRRQGPPGLVGGWEDPARSIELDLQRTRHFLGVQLSAADIRRRLARYGFVSVQAEGCGLRFRVPPHRLWDVEYVDDLYEELARSIGYNNLPVVLPPVGLGAEQAPEQRRRERVEEVLLGHGLYEVITDGFYGRWLPERLDLPPEHPLTRHVEVLNALDRGYSLLRNSPIGQAIQTVSDNLRMRTEEVRCYEWVKLFQPNSEAQNGVCEEREVLWAILSGHSHDPDWARSPRPVDAWWLKGLVRELSAALRLPSLQVAPADPDTPEYDLLHPGRQLAIQLGDQRVGVLGEIHPRLLAAWKIKRARPCYLQLDAQVLHAPPHPPAYAEPDPLHPIERSLAFTLPYRVHASEVASTLEQAGPAWLATVRVVDRFDHTLEDGSTGRAITFQLIYEQTDTGRTAEEVNTATERLIEAVREAHGDAGVRLRA